MRFLCICCGRHVRSFLNSSSIYTNRYRLWCLFLRNWLLGLIDSICNDLVRAWSLLGDCGFDRLLYRLFATRLRTVLCSDLGAVMLCNSSGFGQKARRFLSFRPLCTQLPEVSLKYGFSTKLFKVSANHALGGDFQSAGKRLTISTSTSSRAS